MDFGSIFLILGLLVLVGLYISRPLIERHSTVVSNQEQAHSHLLAERDRLLNALGELDFDFALGKIPEGEYPPQRALLLQAGAEVLRQLDAYQPPPVDDALELRIEAAIAARRADAARVAQSVGSQPAGTNGRRLSTPDDDLETMIAGRRRERNGKSAGFCPKCGRPVQKTDQFCPHCGKTLA